VVAGAIALTFVVACGGDDSQDSFLAAGGGPTILEQFRFGGLASDPSGGAWILEAPLDADAGPVLYRFDDERGLSELAQLPDWGAYAPLGLADGRLAVGAVRCAEAATCESTIAELAILSPNGAIESTTPLTERRGPPNESDAIRVVGQVGTSVWVYSFDGQLLEVEDAVVRRRVQAEGDPCIVDGDVYTLTVVEGELGPEISPTSDPAHPDRYTVRRISGAEMEPVKGGTVEAPSNSVGLCVGSEFETFVDGSTSSYRWTEASGWVGQERALSPERVRSTDAEGLQGDRFIVDGDGQLLVRENGTWRGTSVRFAIERPDGGPPLVLLADRSASSVAACISRPIERPEDFALECHSGSIG
jgi:hypothetical protein